MGCLIIEKPIADPFDSPGERTSLLLRDKLVMGPLGGIAWKELLLEQHVFTLAMIEGLLHQTMMHFSDHANTNGLLAPPLSAWLS